MRHITIKIFGDLKETGLRFSAMHEAYKAGVNGITKYTSNSAVYIEAEGYPEQLENYKAWCLGIAKKYNNAKIEINSDQIKGYTEFNIID
jgi:acylphosphatase